MALEIDVQRTELFVELRAMLLSRGLWEAFADSCMRQIRRLESVYPIRGTWALVAVFNDRKEEICRLALELAAICREQLHDSEREYVALQAALRSQEDNAALLAALAGWHARHGKLDAMAEALRKLFEAAPSGSARLRELVDAFRVLSGDGLPEGPERRGLRAHFVTRAGELCDEGEVWRALDAMQAAICLGGPPATVAPLYRWCAWLAEDRLGSTLLAELYDQQADELTKKGT
jgi:hypothetical protein